MAHSVADAFRGNFLGNSPNWYKLTIIGFLIVNPLRITSYNVCYTKLLRMNGKVMETTGLLDLLTRIAGEYAAAGSIYGIPKEAFEGVFELEAKSPGMSVMGKRVSLPVGP